jgi:hypothetical protein
MKQKREDPAEVLRQLSTWDVQNNSPAMTAQTVRRLSLALATAIEGTSPNLADAVRFMLEREGD